MTIIEILKNKTFTTNEQAVVDYIINNPLHFLEIKPQEMAKTLFVSMATVYRLMGKLGYEGIHDFKYALMLEMNDKTESRCIIDADYPIDREDSFREMVDKLQILYEATYEETAHYLDYSILKDWVSAVNSHHKIIIFATSSNQYFAENFAFQMKEIGYDVEVPKDEYQQRLSAANSREEDIALIISYEGRSGGLANVVQILEKRPTEVFLITSRNKSWISDKISRKIYLSSIENHYHKISSFSSRYSLLVLLDLMYVSVFKSNYKKNSEYKIENYQRIRGE